MRPIPLGCQPLLLDGHVLLQRLAALWIPTFVCLPRQVVNTNLLFANPFPEGRAIAIYNQSAQLVRAADLSVVPPTEARAQLPDSASSQREVPAAVMPVRLAGSRAVHRCAAGRSVSGTTADADVMSFLLSRMHCMSWSTPWP